MTVDPSVIPGLLLLLAELIALAGVGYVIVRVALREEDVRVALAQGLVVGPAIWGVVVNLVMYALPGMAGAIAGWIFVLALAGVLVWRSRPPIRPQLRTAGMFSLAALALFWAALASRQLLTTPDAPIHMGLAASIRAGLFPPEIPWNPGAAAPYHYGLYLLSGLLAPPSGPDLAFVEELLGAYVWIGLFLIVATTLLRRAYRFAVLISVPLLLTPGGWTLMFNEPFSILEIPIPTGIPTDGLRASLQEIYWPFLGLPLKAQHDMPPDIWTPSFPLSYALAFVVLERAARAKRRSWPTILTLAALIGFLGLTSSTLTPIVVALWIGLEAVWLFQSRRAGTAQWGDLIRPLSGVALAGLLLLAGSLSTVVLGDSGSSGLSLGWNVPLDRLRIFGTLDRLPGGVGVLGLGPLTITVVALLLAWRDRLVQALAAGAGLLLLASLLLVYEPKPDDLVRIEGQARNLALFALLVAFCIRFVRLRGTRWRYAVGAAFVFLVTWPTAAAPVRNVGLAIGNGVELTNPERPEGPRSFFGGRFWLGSLPSDRIAAYIRDHTAVDARVFSPRPHQMTYATGRPNASGYAGLVHVIPKPGPEYEDARDYLEPAALRRLGIEYVYAPDSWTESLPEEAVSWLHDPNMFELLVHDDSERLYRVLPNFLTLDPPPTPASHEALRRAVPSSATVFLPTLFHSRSFNRVAWALSHTRQFGAIRGPSLHVRSPWRIDPLGDQVPDLVVTSASFVPLMFPHASRLPIWWNDKIAVYALDGVVDPVMPPRPQAEPPPFNVRVSEISESDGRIAFTATFDDRAPDQWTSQDWVLIPTEAPPWDIPAQVISDGTPVPAMWFISYVNPGKGRTSLAYEFDFQARRLAVRREQDVMKPLDRSEGVLDAGSYLLAVRLRHEYKPNQWRTIAIMEVLRVTISETGEVSYQVHEDAGG
ncbi:MAG: hypothetical protein OXG46_05855 [Chloroflexi bacterium]|nr:hypothetical protein [Chloroflexota bacterium]